MALKNKILNSITELIGHTPLLRLNSIVKPGMSEILLKLEFTNPGGSVKDRVCLAMIEKAEAEGILQPGSVIIEATTGNTGIGLAMIAAAKGYSCILTMPSDMSLERIFILKSYGAKVVLTSASKGIKGAIRKAREIAKNIPGSFLPEQFDNLTNPEIHRETTAVEIFEMTEGKLHAFVAGVGTGGTISGVGEVLKKMNPEIEVIAVEPKNCAVLSGCKPQRHRIQGIGAGFIPGILNQKIIDRIIKVDDDDAFEITKLLARTEGVFAGISTGASVWGALQIASELGEGKTVVTMAPDTGERYFSMQQYYEA